MDARFTTDVVKIEIWLTPAEAKDMLKDFDKTTEPSRNGKKLYGLLNTIGNMGRPFSNEPTSRRSVPYSELHDKIDDLETVSLPHLSDRARRTLPDDPDETSP